MVFETRILVPGSRISDLGVGCASRRPFTTGLGGVDLLLIPEYRLLISEFRFLIPEFRILIPEFRILILEFWIQK